VELILACRAGRRGKDQAPPARAIKEITGVDRPREIMAAGRGRGMEVIVRIMVVVTNRIRLVFPGR
jgi:hypothetical protein